MSLFFEEIIRSGLPSTWRVVRGDFVLSERKEFSESGSEELLSVSEYTGVTPRKENLSEGEHLSRAESLEGYRLVHVNDLVMNYMLAWKGAQGVSPYAGITSPAYSVFRINQENAICSFIHHLFRSDLFKNYLRSESAGIIESRLRFYPESLRSLKLGIPSLEEQTRISIFLDCETTRIDALIAKKTRFIELLKEKRQALITQAVTKGLNPNVKMKDSGVEWLGEVPEHWAVRRVKDVSQFITSGPRGWSENITDNGTLFIQSGDLTSSLGISFETAKRVKVDNDAEAIRTRLENGDVVVCITGAKTGNVAVCSALQEDAHINQHLCLIRAGRNVLPNYLAITLKSDFGQTQLELAQSGLKQGLSLDSVREVLIATPSLQEQKVILDYLKNLMSRIESLISKTDHSITLLKERRAALITAAVTGQIDLREAA